MSYENDRISFYTSINTLWGTETPIRFDTIQDQDNISTGQSPWIHCNLDFSETNQTNLGTNTAVLYSTLGMFMVDIYDKKEKGLTQILKYADIIRSHFMGKSLSHNTIRVTSVAIVKKEPFQGWISRRVMVLFVSNEYTSRI